MISFFHIYIFLFPCLHPMSIILQHPLAASCRTKKNNKNKQNKQLSSNIFLLDSSIFFINTFAFLQKKVFFYIHKTSYFFFLFLFSLILFRFNFGCHVIFCKVFFSFSNVVFPSRNNFTRFLFCI